MSGDRVSYMHQRDPSIDRRYRPRPNNVLNLFANIAEDDDLEQSSNSQDSHSRHFEESADTIERMASVFLRLRPINNRSRNYEVDNNHLKVQPSENTATNNKDLTEKHFEFSKIYNDDVTQVNIYDESVQMSVQNEDDLTLLTYGTSSSGKTYTMFGTEEDAGVVQRAIAHIFAMNEKIVCKVPAAKLVNGQVLINDDLGIRIESKLSASFAKPSMLEKNNHLVNRICKEHGFSAKESEWQHVFVWISFAEIYNEYVYDLLKPVDVAKKRKNLKIISNAGNPYIDDLTSVFVNSASAALDVINMGLRNANYASTKVNANSSRSHSILIVNVIHFSYPDLYSRAAYKFCDLAGSERLKKTENTGSRLKEAQNINTSLMVLGRCFDAMHQHQKMKTKEVVPFRESKLTTLLQKSLLGKEKITTIVTMSLRLDFLEENLQVLNFASIAQQIVYKEPKPECDRRAARSTRFSWFIPRKNDDSNLNTMIAENERLEIELLDLRAVIRQMVSDTAKSEQILRNNLVEEREVQMKTACDKYQKRIEFIESTYKRKIDELKKENEQLRRLNHRLQVTQAETIDIDSDDDDDEDEVGSEEEDGENSSLRILADTTNTIEEDRQGANGESREKKRCLSSSFQ